MSKCRWVLAVWGLLAVTTAGCGESAPKLYPTSGTVTYEGNPVEGAAVMFIPQQGAPSSGMTDASGKYTIMTRGRPGAPAGAYSVTVSKQTSASSEKNADAAKEAAASTPSQGEPSDEEKKQMMQKQQQAQQRMTEMMQGKGKMESALPIKYAIPEGSGLKAVVTDDASKNVFDFPLTPQ